MATSFRIELVDLSGGKPAPTPPIPPTPPPGPALNQPPLNAAQLQSLNRQFPGMSAQIQQMAGLPPAPAAPLNQPPAAPSANVPPSALMTQAQFNRLPSAQPVGTALKAPPTFAEQMSSAALMGGAPGAANAALAAAGPIGMAIAAAKAEVDKKIAEMKETARAMLIGVPQQGAAAARDLAGNRNLEGLLKGADAAGQALGKIPVVGEPLAFGFKMMTSHVRDFVGVVDSFVERGNQLKGFSGDLTGANAMKDVRNLLADIKEAQVLGTELAQLTDAQSRFETELRDDLLPIKKEIIPMLTNLIEAVIPWLPVMEEGVLDGVAVLEMIGKIVNNIAEGDLKNAGKWLADLPAHLLEIHKRVMEQQHLQHHNPAEEISAQVQFQLMRQNQVAARQPFDPTSGAGGARLDIPAFRPRP